MEIWESPYPVLSVISSKTLPCASTSWNAPQNFRRSCRLIHLLVCLLVTQTVVFSTTLFSASTMWVTQCGLLPGKLLGHISPSDCLSVTLPTTPPGAVIHGVCSEIQIVCWTYSLTHLIIIYPTLQPAPALLKVLLELKGQYHIETHPEDWLLPSKDSQQKPESSSQISEGLQEESSQPPEC